MLKLLAGILHTLSCTKPHSQDMQDLLQPRNPSVCYFYLEESLAEGERVDHKKWEEVASDMCQKYNSTPEEVLRFIPTLLECRQKIEPILSKNRSLEGLCHLILFS